ncbi:MAG: glucosaminidase domain-containing protein [Flavobacteriaceae bacterium]|nr:glucosaminidase domain-containing protein [Flavobacteriaceae bacterium]
MYSILRLACFVLVTAIMLSCSVTKTVRTKPQPVSKKEAPVKKKTVKTPTVKVVKSVKLTQEQKVKAYLDRFGPIARAEMRQYKIPASITLAQGILESGTGEGTLAKVGNNHFGIKCHRGWNGGRMYHDDDAKGECFRTYEDPAESYRDHSVFLSGRQRYAFLFKFHKRDYKAWARGLKKAGYATDPKYPKKLISIIQRYELYQYDTKKGVKTKSGKKYQKPIVRNVKDKIHSVEVGDTLYSIARQYSISVDEIKKHNKLDDNTIFKGQELIIPKKK